MNSADSTNTVNVKLGTRSYPIEIGVGLLAQIESIAPRQLAGKHIVVITDDNVGGIYLSQLKTSLETVATRVDSISVAPGEQSKSVAVCDRLWQQVDDLNTDRQSVVVALGGGVMGDLAGFVAASYARGIDFVQIPTSLLAQVDSSVGGKVGINLPKSKNMVGAFWQPKLVVIDPSVLQTLDEANYIAGMAEVIKYGLIMDEPLFQFLESKVDAIKARDMNVLSKIIAWCCQCKADVVEADETESTGRRAILNYGHTYGHAIESVYGYGNYLHGQAIAIGMVCAARLAHAMGMVDADFCDRQKRLFESIGLPVDCPQGKHAELLQAMQRDKKVDRGVLKFILPTKMGHVELVETPGDQAILKSLNNH